MACYPEMHTPPPSDRGAGSW